MGRRKYHESATLSAEAVIPHRYTVTGSRSTTFGGVHAVQPGQANDELVAFLKEQIVQKDDQLGLVLEQLRELHTQALPAPPAGRRWWRFWVQWLIPFFAG